MEVKTYENYGDCLAQLHPSKKRFDDLIVCYAEFSKPQDLKGRKLNNLVFLHLCSNAYVLLYDHLPCVDTYISTLVAEY